MTEIGVRVAELLSNDVRLAALFAALLIVLVFEWAFPLFRYPDGHARNAAVNIVVTAPFLGVNLVVAPVSPYAATAVTSAQFGVFYWLNLPPAAQLLLGIAGLDLFAYFAHVTLHKLPWMWRFHRVHHSDALVDVTTAFRQHPGETLWRVGWHLLGIVILGTPAWVLVIYLTLSAFNAQLEHANIRLPTALDRWLRLVFVTPNMHKVHHSRQLPETDMNYSNLLSVWDRLGRTYSRGPRFNDLHYGLDGFDNPTIQSFTGLMKLPFVSPALDARTAPETERDRHAA